MWFIGVGVEQETTAPPPKKNPGSAPALSCVHVLLWLIRTAWQKNIYRKQECFNLPIKLFILLFILPPLSQIKFVRMIKNKNNMKKTIKK